MSALIKWALFFSFGFAASAYADAVRLTLKVEFKKGSRVVEPAYLPLVAEVAKFLEKYPTANATIEGHSDNVGSEALNLKISKKRAEAVRELLILRFAIDPRRLTAVGYGKDRPIADNGTEEGRFRNRRVVASLEAEEGTFEEEKAEIELAPPTKKAEIAPAPPPVPIPVPAPAPKPLAEDDEDYRIFGARFLAGMVSGPSGVGVSYGWNPVVYRRKKFKASALAGLLHLRDKANQPFFALEVGYVLSMKVLPDCDFDLGAMLASLSGGLNGGVFEGFVGFAYNPHLDFITRISAAYTPILQRNNNLQAFRLGLGFDF